MTYTNELYHHGILGQKWGVRRYQNEDGTYTEAGKQRRGRWAEGYDEKQRLRDRRVYGRGGVRRINRNMRVYGDSISGARSIEADRIAQARKRSRVAGQIGSIAAPIAANIFFDAGVRFIDKYTGGAVGSIVRDPVNNFIVRSGVTAVSSQLGRYGGQSLGMLMSGYSPSKFR